MSRASHFLCFAVVCACLAVYLGNDLQRGFNNSSSLANSLKAVGLLTLAASAFVFWDVSQRHPGENIGNVTTIKIWLIATVRRVLEVFFNINAMKTDFNENQRKFLQHCLETNADTAYSKDFGLGAIKTIGELKSRHPVVNYNHYEQYVDRCVNGEEHVLCKHKIDYFAWTSGTSGKNKTYPYNWHVSSKSTLCIVIMLSEGLRNAFKTLTWLRQHFSTFVIHKTTYTAHGVECGTIGAKLVRSSPSFLYATPSLINEINGEKDVMYTRALFGLQARDIVMIDHILAPSAHCFYKLLETKWRVLCDDIEMGKISEDVSLQDDLRFKLEELLEPNPERAKELRAEFSVGMRAIVRRIWPDVKLAIVFTTGSFSTYRESLSIYLEGVTMYTQLHSATEGIFGVNVNPKDSDTKFLLNPSGMFYEFIPEEHVTDDDPTTLLPSELQIGKCYEIVFTNEFGFYRYRLGDVIKIVDFDGQLPVYEFMYRIGQMLNVFWEKTPESAFRIALQKTFAESDDNIKLYEYTATENINLPDVTGHTSIDRFYIVFLELDSVDGTSNANLPKYFAKQMDDNLRETHETYDVLRGNGSIEQMIVFQVVQGSFGLLKDRILEANDRASAAQFKVPKVLRNKTYLDLMMTNIA